MNDAQTQLRMTKRDLFLAALERDTSRERAAFLDEACAGDPELRAAVEALLLNHKDDSFLESPAVAPPVPADATENAAGTGVREAIGESPGDRIGRYKLLQQIGEGGAGVVFMAEQEAPVRRRVALKILKPGMDTKSVIGRFESERQALALMDHPNIARVLDAGSTTAGRPYFVMDLVRGIRITDYCDQNRLSTRERLALFIQVCQAIQHAHQKGIIHRDIKPSNILVTLHDGVPVPKVIDFGIAKSVDQRLTDKTCFTEFQAFIGTPAYISPEQAEMSGLDIDTRTDIYSLGVLLYEILTGQTPFDARELWSSGLDGMRRTIREQEPASPSTRVRKMSDADRTTTAQRQRSDPARLASLLRGDLDWIVLKALEKDRTRRYATANDLAQDIQRHLESEPVLARPPSTVYRFQKLVRRNKLTFAGASLLAAALVLGATISIWLFLEKSVAYQRAVSAEQEQARLRQESEAARRLAEVEALAARRQAYAADMNLVQQALAANNLGRAQELLTRHRAEESFEIGNQGSEQASITSAPPTTDLRGWEWRYLWQLCQSDALFTLGPLAHEVSALSVSHDGKWVAVGEYGDRGLSIWDLRARQEIARFPPGEGSERFAFSPAAPLLAFYAADRSHRPGPGTGGGRVRLWDLLTRRVVEEFPVDGQCRALAFSADGTQLLIAGGNLDVTLWDLSQQTRLRTVSLPESAGSEGRPPYGGHLAVNRGLNVAAQPLGGGRIRVVDLASGAELWTTKAAEENVTALAFSPDGTKLASGAGFVESAIRLWDVASGRELARLEGHRTFVRALVFWADGETLASASGDQTIHLWDIGSLAVMPPRQASAGPGSTRFDSRFPSRPQRPRVTELQPFSTLRGHRLEVWSLALGPDNTTLVSGSKDGSVLVWDTTTLQRQQAAVTLPVLVRAWRFVPDDEAIVALDTQGRVARWYGVDFQQSQPLLELEIVPRVAHFSPDARFLAAGSPQGAIRVWDLLQGNLLREISSEQGERNLPVTFLDRSGHLVTHEPESGLLRAWDVTTGLEIRSWRIGDVHGRWSDCAFSPDGEWFVTVDNDDIGHLYHLPSDRHAQLAFGLRPSQPPVFSPDARWLAVVSTLGVNQLWETETARKVATLHGFLQGTHSAVFSPDSRRLAIGSNGNEAIKLWDVESQQELLTLPGQGSIFNAVAFSPDGNVLASSNQQGLLHIWRAPSLDEITRVERLAYMNP